MSNELKVGDRVTVNGEEYEICTPNVATNFNSPYLKPIPQKSELEKFADMYVVENYKYAGSPDLVKRDVSSSALALLEHLEQSLDSCLTSYQLFTVASKWCGK